MKTSKKELYIRIVFLVISSLILFSFIELNIRLNFTSDSNLFVYSLIELSLKSSFFFHLLVCIELLYGFYFIVFFIYILIDLVIFIIDKDLSLSTKMLYNRAIIIFIGFVVVLSCNLYIVPKYNYVKENEIQKITLKDCLNNSEEYGIFVKNLFNTKDIAHYKFTSEDIEGIRNNNSLINILDICIKREVKLREEKSNYLCNINHFTMSYDFCEECGLNKKELYFSLFGVSELSCLNCTNTYDFGCEYCKVCGVKLKIF